MTKKWQQLMNQGGSAMERRNFALAAEKFSLALPIAERSCDALERLETLTALGGAYGAHQQFELAEQMYTRALSLCAISDELGSFPVAGCLMSLAYIYKDLGRLKDCRASALKSIELLDGDTTGDPTAILAPLTLLVDLSIRDSSFELAATFLGKAVAIFNQHQSSNSLSYRDKLRKQIEQMPAMIRSRFNLGAPTISFPLSVAAIRS